MNDDEIFFIVARILSLLQFITEFMYPVHVIQTFSYLTKILFQI